MKPDLYFSPRTFTFEDNKGNQLTLDQARKGFEAGVYGDCNIALLTVVDNDWNMDKVKKYYNEI